LEADKEMSSDISPKWAKEIVRFLSVKPQFMLWGNIYDVYPIELGDSITTLRLMDYLKNILIDSGYNQVIKYEPLRGLSLLEGDPETVKKISGESINKDKPLACTLNKSTQTIEKLVNSNQLYSAIILNFASRLPDIAKDDMQEFYYNMFRLAHTATPKIAGDSKSPKFNLLIWLLDKENDIPAWYSLDNVRTKILPIPKPDYSTRKTVIESLAKNIDRYSDLDEIKRKENISLFIDQTSGLHASEMVSIVSLAKREGTPFSEVGDAIRMYKLGIIENPWSKLDLNKIAEADSLLSKRVKGQEYSIRKSSDIIKRSVYNLSGSQYSKFSQRPKGVLFFAGPTGVGKTELAKAITELVFGSETSYIRFDMSEFAHEHADQRLVGAPPGYVGYDVGGQLTNAVKQNPFSVLLFDEIEKAHPKILDIFLQILDDGRLTSGRGETAYFSECLIVFTSNLGIYEQTPDGQKIQRIAPGMPYEKVSSDILKAIEDFFKYKIGRPEILNRIGENIVVFDFIRPMIAQQIFDRMLGNIIYKLGDSYSIKVELALDFRNNLAEICCSDLNMGGRGIGNKLENAFINPLSRSLFEHKAKEGETLIVQDIVKDELAWNLTVQKKSL
jgi:hypothetical protein